MKAEDFENLTEERELEELFGNIQLENLEEMQRMYELQNVNDFSNQEEDYETIPMEYEELTTQAMKREIQYKQALESLAKDDIERFLNNEIIRKEFPKENDEIRPYCISLNKSHIKKMTRLYDLYGEYLALWRGELYSEKSINSKTGDTLYILSYNKNGKEYKKYISAECFASFQALIDLVNITKFMSLKMMSLQRKYVPLPYDFQNEILQNIDKALIHVFQIFLK